MLVGTAMAATLAVALVGLMRRRLADPALAWSLRLGLVAVVGMAVAFLMTSPTPEQLAAAGGPRVAGAYSVGVADGGPRLPVTGWSTVAGDLRVAHFVGLHGLQVPPALGYLLTLVPARRLGDRHRVALVWTVGLAYLASCCPSRVARGGSLTSPTGSARPSARGCR